MGLYRWNFHVLTGLVVAALLFASTYATALVVPSLVVSNRRSCPRATRMQKQQQQQQQQQQRNSDQKQSAVPSSRMHTIALFSSMDPKLREQWERDIEEKSQRRAAQDSRMGEAVAGAVLGGLLLGPFGALFGASLGSSMGSQRALDRAREEEMKQLGISPEMLDMAQEIGVLLERSMDGLRATQSSLETQQRLARRLDRDANYLYEKAKEAIANNNEEWARQLLLQRTDIQDQLKKALVACVEEKRRLEQMERNVSAIEERAREIDTLLRRTVGAKAVQDSSDLGLSLQMEDPLLRKFKDMGIN